MSFGIYQPALLPRQIRSLYYLKLETRKPMTWHARRAVDLYLRQFPDLRFDEAEIRNAPRDFEERLKADPTDS